MMIHSVSIKNFQSHKDTQIQFAPGVNVILGSSNSGKTAIMRALYWVLENRPTGTGFVSHWNRGKSGDPIDPTEVTVKTSDNQTITRRREKNFNGYEINGLVLEAIKTDLPEEVTEASRMSGINVQKQMDAPFLVASSPGQVAKFFNQTIKLDKIDTVLSKAEGSRRSANRDKEAIERDIASTHEELKKYEWLPEAEKRIVEAEGIDKSTAKLDMQIQQLTRIVDNLYLNKKSIDNNQQWASLSGKLEKVQQESITQARYKDTTSRLQENMEKFQNLSKTIEKQSMYIELQPLYQTAEAVTVKIDVAQYDIQRIQGYIAKYNRSREEVERSRQWAELSPVLSKLQKYLTQKEVLGRQIEGLSLDLHSIKKYKEKTQGLYNNIEELKSQLPDTCPLCGGKL